MLIANVLVLFAAYTASATSLLVERQAARILADFRTVHSDLVSLTTSIKSWDGSAGGSFKIQDAENRVEKDLQATYSDIQHQTAGTCADVSQEINYANSTLEPDVRAATAALVARKADFAKIALVSTVKRNLQGLKADIDPALQYLINAGGACSPAFLKSLAQSVKTAIDKEITDAYNAFGASRVKRTPAQVLSLLKQVDARSNDLCRAVNGFFGQPGGGVSIQNAEQDLEAAIKAATSQAQKEKTAACPITNRIINYINTRLEPDFYRCLNSTLSKKQQFKNAGLSSTLNADFNALKSYCQQLGNALVKVACPASKQNATAALNKLIADFNSR